MVADLSGIEEKLKRSHESIGNLNGEIIAFFNESENPIRSDEDLDAIFEKHLQLGKRKVPLRFAVLTGEIIHHFRSTLDHLAWLLAIADIRENHPKRIEFPVFHDRLTKDGAPSIKGKVEIFASPVVQQRIRDIQPYEGIDHDPDTDMLWIIHDLDRKAKHRELPLMFTAFSLGSELLNRIGNLYGGENIPIPDWVAAQMKQDIQLSPQIAFREFSKGKSQPLIPSLTQLEGEVHVIIDLFKSEL